MRNWKKGEGRGEKRKEARPPIHISGYATVYYEC